MDSCETWWWLKIADATERTGIEDSNYGQRKGSKKYGYICSSHQSAYANRAGRLEGEIILTEIGKTLL